MGEREVRIFKGFRRRLNYLTLRAPGIGNSVSLFNSSDLYVGGTPEGDNLHGTFEFLRISLGTLKDAKTDIDELYAWQFDGPFLYDFAGNKPKGKRDAGALEKVD